MIALQVRTLKRREAMPDMTKPEWWVGVRQGLERVASWYAVAMEIPALTDADLALPSTTSSQFKALAKEAVLLKEGDWLDAYEATAQANMRHVVTLGRRCAGNPGVSGWKKADGKLSNKLANCIMKEMDLADKLRRQLEARVG